MSLGGKRVSLISLRDSTPTTTPWLRRSPPAVDEEEDAARRDASAKEMEHDARTLEEEETLVAIGLHGKFVGKRAMLL